MRNKIYFLYIIVSVLTPCLSNAFEPLHHMTINVEYTRWNDWTLRDVYAIYYYRTPGIGCKLDSLLVNVTGDSISDIYTRITYEEGEGYCFGSDTIYLGRATYIVNNLYTINHQSAFISEQNSYIDFKSFTHPVSPRRPWGLKPENPLVADEVYFLFSDYKVTPCKLDSLLIKKNKYSIEMYAYTKETNWQFLPPFCYFEENIKLGVLNEGNYTLYFCY